MWFAFVLLLFRRHICIHYSVDFSIACHILIMSKELAPSELEDVKRKIRETEDKLRRIEDAVRRKNPDADEDDIAARMYY
jgi:hypothetical protein